MLNGNLSRHNLPILYNSKNNISVFGLEKLHPFDTCKYQKVAESLIKSGTVESFDTFIEANALDDEQLKTIHSQAYLNSLYYSETIASIISFHAASYIPNFILRYLIIEPMKYHAGATWVAPDIALIYGWAICLSGGMHHASSRNGNGWCVFADISLSIKNFKITYPHLKKVMIIDLDAHQGDGYERDKKDGYLGPLEDVYILDMFNYVIGPRDVGLKDVINKRVILKSHTGGDEYNSLLVDALMQASKEFVPDIIYYNAGTDILSGDKYGLLNVSEESVIERDEIVFKYALDRSVPIVMTTSGGYTTDNDVVISNSIDNLFDKLHLRRVAQQNYDKRLLSRSCILNKYQST
jgi:histone deacetylase 11